MLVLMIEVGGGRFLLPCRDVERVIEPPVLGAMHGAPEAVLGAFVHQGALVRVVDLSRLLLGRACEQRIGTRVVLVRIADLDGDRTLGLLTERVLEARRCEGTPVAESGGAGLGLGWVVEDGSFVRLLDLHDLARADGIGAPASARA